MSDRFDRSSFKKGRSKVVPRMQALQHGVLRCRLTLIVIMGIFAIMAICISSESDTQLERLVKTARLVAFPPPDLYCPYVVQRLSNATSQYQFSFEHRYAGKQEFILNIVNNNPKKFDYNHPDMINLDFIGMISEEKQEVRKKFEKKFTSYFLMQGTNSIPIYRYEMWSNKLLKAKYSIGVEIRGDVKAFIERYPESFMSVRNGTVE